MTIICRDNDEILHGRCGVLATDAEEPPVSPLRAFGAPVEMTILLRRWIFHPRAGYGYLAGAAVAAGVSLGWARVPVRLAASVREPRVRSRVRSKPMAPEMEVGSTPGRLTRGQE